MTKNQQLLQILAPYRDKTLSFGCEVKDTHNQKHYFVCNKSVNGDLFVSYGTLESNQYRIAEERLVVIGHPLTLATVLMALQKSYKSKDLLYYAGYEDSDGLLNISTTDYEILIDLTQTPDQYSEEVSGALVELLSK